MTFQLGSSLLDACVLAVLSRGDAYGYILTQQVKEVIDISESTLYPILKRLESAGCLTTFTQEHNGRMRKYYRITAAGLARIRAFLDEWEEMRKMYAFIENNGCLAAAPHPAETIIGKDGSV